MWSSLTRDFERKLRFCFIRRLFFQGSKSCVKENSVNGHLHKMKEGSGNGASLFMEALRGEPGGRTPLLGTLKYWRWSFLTIDTPFGNLEGKLV